MLHPLLPGFFFVANGQRRRVPDEGKTQQQRIFNEAREPSVSRQYRVLQSELGEALAVAIDERADPEFLRKPIELSPRGRPNGQIDEMGFDSALGKKTQRLPRVGAFVRTENLNFQTAAPMVS